MSPKNDNVPLIKKALEALHEVKSSSCSVWMVEVESNPVQNYPSETQSFPWATHFHLNQKAQNKGCWNKNVKVIRPAVVHLSCCPVGCGGSPSLHGPSVGSVGTQWTETAWTGSTHGLPADSYEIRSEKTLRTNRHHLCSRNFLWRSPAFKNVSKYWELDSFQINSEGKKLKHLRCITTLKVMETYFSLLDII